MRITRGTLSEELKQGGNPNRGSLARFRGSVELVRFRPRLKLNTTEVRFGAGLGHSWAFGLVLEGACEGGRLDVADDHAGCVASFDGAYGVPGFPVRLGGTAACPDAADG